jgi:hypothetical protein
MLIEVILGPLIPFGNMHSRGFDLPLEGIDDLVDVLGTGGSAAALINLGPILNTPFRHKPLSGPGRGGIPVL